MTILTEREYTCPVCYALQNKRNPMIYDHANHRWHCYLCGAVMRTGEDVKAVKRIQEYRAQCERPNGDRAEPKSYKNTSSGRKRKKPQKPPRMSDRRFMDV